MLVFWHLLVDEHHVGGDGVSLVLDPLPHGLHVGGDGLSLVCLQLGLGHPHPGHHVNDGRPLAPLQPGPVLCDLLGRAISTFGFRAFVAITERLEDGVRSI